MHEGERWQEYYRNGSPIPGGTISPFDAHTGVDNSDYVYAVACVWLYRRNNGIIEVLFQKRSPYVDRNANKWDTSSGGHVNDGEEILVAAVRELREEIGATADASELEFLFSRNDGRRIAYVFLCDYSSHPNAEVDFHFDDQEVSEVRWVPLPKVPNYWCSQAKRPLATDFIHYQCLMEKLSSLK